MDIISMAGRGTISLFDFVEKIVKKNIKLMFLFLNLCFFIENMK